MINVRNHWLKYPTSILRGFNNIKYAYERVALQLTSRKDDNKNKYNKAISMMRGKSPPSEHI